MVVFFIFSEIGNAQFQFHRNDSVLVYKGSNKLNLAWCGGLNAAQFSTADLNLDGMEDLVVYDRSDYKIMTFINGGTPNSVDYTYAYRYEKKFPPIDGWMLMRDFNRDGKKDIFCATSGGIRVYKNTSNIGDGLQFELYEDLIISYQSFSATFDSTKFFNLYVSSVDIPSISDIDGDGDLDILSFGVLGSYIEYHRNMSIERYGNTDTLDYVLKNNCWGYFSETGSSTNKLILYDTCYYNVAAPNRHAGSAILALDNNNDGVSDLLISDVSFNNIVLAINGGIAPNTNSAMASQDTSFPSYNVPIDMAIFPGIFYEDINNDSKKDLLLSPNTSILTENYKSALFYENLGTNSLPNFNYQQDNFLQDQAIELGTQSNVTFFDYNADGKLDMVVSSYGYFNRTTLDYTSKLMLFENTGTTSSPQFTFKTDDYEGISTMGLGLSLYPTFADIDNDADIDLIIGNNEGKLHLLTNTAGAGNTASFTLTTTNIQSNTGVAIDVGQNASPQLFDFDTDGDFDLVIGEKNGIINYYQNVGTQTTFLFQFVTDSLGKIAIHEPWDVNGASTGYSTPFFFTEMGVTYLMVGSQQGEVYLYNNINPSYITQPYTVVDTLIKKREVGQYTAVSVFDIDGNAKHEFYIGNERGGVASFYPGEDLTNTSSLNKIVPTISLYPNPAFNNLTIKIYGNNTNKKYEGTITSISGKIRQKISLQSTGESTLNIAHLDNGIYFIQLQIDNKLITQKFIVLKK